MRGGAGNRTPGAPNVSALAPAAALAAHEADTTAVHGITDASLLATKSLTWTPATVYKAGQVVLHQGVLYEAVADFTSAASFSGSNWHRVSPGEIGYAEITANVSVTSISTQDVAGLSITVTVRPNRPIVLEWEGFLSHAAINTYAVAQIREGTTVLGEADWQYSLAGVVHRERISRRLTPSAGSHTYKVVLGSNSAISAATIVCNADNPSFLRAVQQ